jgi:ABC-type antimicrobial peptide transport system permease subunit
MVKADDSATLERVRTYLATHLPPFAWDPTVAGGNFPQTFGEVADIRDHSIAAVQRVIYIMVGLTLLVAGCSLAVAMGGGLLERKRPFTLLRLSGAPSRILYRTVLLESLLPLAAATVTAAVVGFAVAIPTASALARGAGLRMPDSGYYLTMGTGLAVCVLVVLSGLPLLGRLTSSDNARFE